MDAKLRIELPWPDRALSPNGRVHWAAKSREVAKHREWGWIAAVDSVRKQGWPKNVEQADVAITFVDPRPLRRDRDNHIGLCKSYFDGFVDAGVIVNDCGFRVSSCDFEIGPKRGVRFDITIADKRAA